MGATEKTSYFLFYFALYILSDLKRRSFVTFTFRPSSYLSHCIAPVFPSAFARNVRHSVSSATARDIKRRWSHSSRFAKIGHLQRKLYIRRAIFEVFSRLNRPVTLGGSVHAPDSMVGDSK